ncbi:E3 ubiquitin-protein ligase MYLIP-A [Taenia crassiceps]|uniref:E3 ubiquitin-protein ligase MYLIP-A n=1 Tax=Taenia crassiceps TaxID=6207 RepID=A0ABR4QE14_9CEST
MSPSPPSPPLPSPALPCPALSSPRLASPPLHAFTLMPSVNRLAGLKTVTISGRVVTLNLLEDDASVKMRNYELSSKRSADCLYRSITELHCFFRCDNVRDDVLNRTNPGINFSTIFDHNNTREYTFDVRYTSREVHDRARRNLYHAASEASSSFGNALAMATATTTVVGSAESAGASSQLPIGSMHQLEDSTHIAAASPTSLNRITSPASHSDSMASMEEVSGGSGDWLGEVMPSCIAVEVDLDLQDRCGCVENGRGCSDRRLNRAGCEKRCSRCVSSWRVTSFARSFARSLARLGVRSHAPSTRSLRYHVHIILVEMGQEGRRVEASGVDESVDGRVDGMILSEIWHQGSTDSNDRGRDGDGDRNYDDHNIVAYVPVPVPVPVPIPVVVVAVAAVVDNNGEVEVEVEVEGGIKR